MNLKPGDKVEITGIGVGTVIEQGLFMLWTKPCDCHFEWHRDWTFFLRNGNIVDLDGRIDEKLTSRMKVV